jgi:hypothetical protein
MTAHKMVQRLMTLVAVSTLLTIGTEPASAQETSVGGLFFGDYYGVVNHNDADLDGANGFWARRLYLTINSKFNSSWDARVRFEAATPGKFETAGTMDPFVKDLWVRWKKGNQSILLGLSSSPTWSFLEGEWGYRFLEKTPLDLFKMGSSRDFGIAFKGSFDESRKVRYHVMLGNGASTKAETNTGKKVMGALQFYPSGNLMLEVYADREDRADDEDRTTYTGTAIVKGERGRVGFLAARQLRSAPGTIDVNVDVFSVFGVVKASERVNLVARWDRMAQPIPDGGKISYFRMDPTSKGNFFLAGLDITLDGGVHLTPNLEVVSYDEDAIGSDVFLKTTFYVKF